jgi:uncharacterized lipoprotein YddW (UPF0748 family)
MPGIYKESKQYVHEQATASPIWTIQHNMGALAAVDVYVEENGVMQKIIPAATNYINPMVMEVVFSTARTGRAIASA